MKRTQKKSMTVILMFAIIGIVYALTTVVFNIVYEDDVRRSILFNHNEKVLERRRTKGPPPGLIIESDVRPVWGEFKIDKDE